jgi:hypothetical protein
MKFFSSTVASGGESIEVDGLESKGAQLARTMARGRDRPVGRSGNLKGKVYARGDYKFGT